MPEPNPTRARWRAMAPADLPAVAAIADAVHPLYPEPPEVPAERLALFPAGCLVAAGADGDRLGYAISHPGRLGQPPALAIRLGALPANADCLYLHDVALLPRARGMGLGEAVVAHLRAMARDAGFRHLALVAVNGSAPYWHRHGFRPYAAGSDALAAKLASYGGDAAYLVG